MSHVAGLIRSRLVRHKATVVIALVAALVSSGTAAAVSYLTLGTTNAAAATTTLKSGVNGAIVQLSNTNATGGTSARGLGIRVPAGRAPITVNATAGKATNLNADKLDGLDSTKFTRGSRTTVLSKRVVVGSSAALPVLLELPGLGHLTVWCPDADPWEANMRFENTTTEEVRVFTDRSLPYPYYRAHTLAPASGDLVITSWDTTRDTSGSGFGLSAEIGAGSGTANRNASIQVRAYRPFAGSGCEFQATAILWFAQ